MRVLECVYACRYAGVCAYVLLCVVAVGGVDRCIPFIMLVDVMSVLFAYVCTLTAFQDTFLGE